MRIVTPLLAGLCLAFAMPAAAQEAEATEPGRLALADRYLDLTMGAGLRKFLSTYYEEAYAESGMPPDQRAWWAENMTSAMDRTLTAMSGDLRDDVADIYSTSELEALIALYSSPVGRSIAEKDMELSVRMQEAMAPHVLTLMTDLTTKYCLRFDCTTRGGGAAKFGS